jgi:protein-disulfide isomerase
MKRILAGLLLAVVTAIAGVLASRAQISTPRNASATPNFTTEQRAEIVDIVRTALKSDPTILRDAVQALRNANALKQEAAARAAIAEINPALTQATGDPIAGNPNGDVTIVEFFDVRCPYCRRMLPTVAELLRRDPKIRLVYKDIPILGAASVLGARAELAAQKQGGYQKMHDLLMSGSPDITEDTVRAAASRVGLDWERLQRDMTDPSVQSRIDTNLALAHKLDIEGTPAYIIGTKLLPGAVRLAELEDAVAVVRRK